MIRNLFRQFGGYFGGSALECDGPSEEENSEETSSDGSDQRILQDVEPHLKQNGEEEIGGAQIVRATKPVLPENSPITNAEIPLLKLLEIDDVTVRLSNCLLNADRNGELPISTIGGYLGVSKQERATFLRLPNFGRKSLAELDLLAKHFMEAYNQDSPSELPVEWGTGG
jgi:hypothetical protein